MEIEHEGAAAYAATGGKDFDAAKPCIVFLHGAGMDHSVWVLQTRYFAYRGWSVLAVDLPGHGRSGGAALETVAANADWLAGYLTALGVQTAALVGHSMGALIAFDFASRYPERARGVALVGAAASMPVHPDLIASAEADDRKAVELICDWGHGPTGHWGGNVAPGLWILGGGLRLLERAKPGALAKDLKACAAYDGVAGQAGQVTAPTLVLAAAADKMTPAKAGAKLAGAIPGADYRVLPGAGHMMMLEQPDQTLDALKTFFTK